jgi:hypothetical protein
VQVRDTKLLKIRHLVPKTGQIARVEVEIAECAQHLVGLKPIGLRLTRLIKCLEILRTVAPRGKRQNDKVRKLVEARVVLAVKSSEKLEKLRKLCLKSCPKGPTVGIVQRCEDLASCGF